MTNEKMKAANVIAAMLMNDQILANEVKLIMGLYADPSELREQPKDWEDHLVEALDNQEATPSHVISIANEYLK